MTLTLAAAAIIDPLAPAGVGGWHGAHVTVRRVGGESLGPRRLRVCRRGGRLIVEHRLTAWDLCDDLTTMIAAELGGTEMSGGHVYFEEIFTGIVLSTVSNPMAAWRSFYVKSLARLESGAAAFAPIHARAAALIAGTDVIDLGSCFGFFPLRLAERGFDVLATDLSTPTMELLAAMGDALARPVRTLACDAANVPLPDRSTDTVTAVHLLEHLAPQTAAAVIDEALRLARRRVIIAVPFESEPTACYGHVQRFDRTDLDRLAQLLRDRHRGLRATVTEHHGGWLVLDR